MDVSRIGRIGAIVLAGSLVLTACSEDSSDNSSDSASSSIDCVSGTIKASGSSAQKNAMTDWINAYQTACPDATIEYSPSGSGAGVQDFLAGQNDFAGSDSALKDDETGPAAERCENNPALNLPMVVGPIAVAFNVEGVDSLTLTPDVIAGIFGNTITNWNDPAIAELNSGANLPDATIAQFHRSDSSGTTDNFTKYLSAAAPDVWTYDSGKEWKAPGGQGSKGSDGVASSLKSTPNSIGYVEYSFTEESSDIVAAAVDNGGGAVELSAESAAAALASATRVGTGNDYALDLQAVYTTTEAGAYPIVLVTYEIVCQAGGTNVDLVKSFLTYTSSEDGQAELANIGYAGIGDLQPDVAAAVASIS